MYRLVLALSLIVAVPALAGAQAPSDQLPANYVADATPHTMRTSLAAAGGGGVLGHRSNGNVLGIDSLPNWSSYFYEAGLDSNGFPQFTWPYTMVGRSPFANDDPEHGEHGGRGRTTTIGAPIVPVILDLRNADGSPRFLGGKRMIVDPTQYVTPVLKSPVFSTTSYTSSNRPTQFGDAIQRAEFFHAADDDWHTVLRPRVAPARTMVLRKGTYSFSANADGTCCRFVIVDVNAFVNALFPATANDTTTPVGAAENAGDITTADLSTFLFANTFLQDPTGCCIIGFHTYDLEPGSAANGWREKRYVLNYSSWVSQGIFSDTTFGDVTPLSHEIVETFDDPFVNNTTPWWLAPNGLCQNNLETGDVIEGLPNAQFPITMNGFTYHPQNEALLQWFAGVTPSSAIDHAYSYPDIGVLTKAAKPRNPGCKP
jgi:hypothetical protein